MNYFSRHVSGDDLRQALKQLAAAGHISLTERKTKGRSARVWTADVFQQDENEDEPEAESSSSTQTKALNPGLGTGATPL
jgi:hypothetical protein